MRISPFVFGLLTFGVLTACSQEQKANLDQFQWKKRIILTYPTNEEAWAKQAKLAQQFNSQIKDRDLIIIRLDSKSEHLSQAQLRGIAKQYKLSKGNHTLIGKDGGVKDQQTGSLNFQKWFDLIDTMPMRQSDMQP